MSSVCEPIVLLSAYLSPRIAIHDAQVESVQLEVFQPRSSQDAVNNLLHLQYDDPYLLVRKKKSSLSTSFPLFRIFIPFITKSRGRHHNTKALTFLCNVRESRETASKQELASKQEYLPNTEDRQGLFVHGVTVTLRNLFSITASSPASLRHGNFGLAGLVLYFSERGGEASKRKRGTNTGSGRSVCKYCRECHHRTSLGLCLVFHLTSILRQAPHYFEHHLTHPSRP